MNISRRSFLGGTLLLAATAKLGISAPLPSLYGDGLHNDTAALKAMIAGDPFIVEGKSIVATNGELRGGKYLISETIDFKGGWIVKDCHLIRAQNFSGDNTVIFSGGFHVNGLCVNDQDTPHSLLFTEALGRDHFAVSTSEWV